MSNKLWTKYSLNRLVLMFMFSMNILPGHDYRNPDKTVSGNSGVVQGSLKHYILKRDGRGKGERGERMKEEEKAEELKSENLLFFCLGFKKLMTFCVRKVKSIGSLDGKLKMNSYG